MPTKPTIITVSKNNISQYPPTCFMKADNEGYKLKLEWIKKLLAKGLKIKLLYLENDKKCNGFIEYLPGDQAWRAVDAKGYMFIHCVWIFPNKAKGKGNASALIKEVIADAKKAKMKGVAVIVSDGPFMAGKGLFLKNGFKTVDQDGIFYLMVKEFKKASLPKFKDWRKQLKKQSGWQMIYSRQCPWVARSIKELEKIARKNKLKVKVTELKTAKQAQDAPSIYAVFNLIHDGKILADHYISARRFENILKKELNKKK